MTEPSWIKKVSMPCGCAVDVDTRHFTKGDRGVRCSRHERAFIVSAVMPATPDHRVTAEIPYPQEE